LSAITGALCRFSAIPMWPPIVNFLALVEAPGCALLRGQQSLGPRFGLQ
jgi:hypothetical protein